MLVFQIVGQRGSGKTTTIEMLIKEFNKKGLKTGSIKSIGCPFFSLDNNKKSNTKRHLEAGSFLTVALSENETDFIYKEKLDLDKVLKFFLLENTDIVIVEGGYAYDLPRIICAKTKDDLPFRITKNTFAISGILTNNLTSKEAENLVSDLGISQSLQFFNVKTDATKLSDHILNTLTPYLGQTPSLEVNEEIKKHCLNCHSKQHFKN